jgi:hypothetical protein
MKVMEMGLMIAMEMGLMKAVEMGLTRRIIKNTSVWNLKVLFLSLTDIVMV